MGTLAPAGELLISKAQRRVAEDIRVRVSLLMSEEWRRQMEGSHEFFKAGKEGYSLSDSPAAHPTISKHQREADVHEQEGPGRSSQRRAQGPDDAS